MVCGVVGEDEMGSVSVLFGLCMAAGLKWDGASHHTRATGVSQEGFCEGDSSTRISRKEEMYLTHEHLPPLALTHFCCHSSAYATRGCCRCPGRCRYMKILEFLPSRQQNPLSLSWPQSLVPRSIRLVIPVCAPHHHPQTIHSPPSPLFCAKAVCMPAIRASHLIYPHLHKCALVCVCTAEGHIPAQADEHGQGAGGWGG